MRAEAEHLRRATGRGRCDPTQPRVPAGNPQGGQRVGRNSEADYAG